MSKKFFRPAALIKIGIPRTRLDYWRSVGYAPASGHSSGGGVVEYAAREALIACLLHWFVDGEGYRAEDAALMLKALEPYDVPALTAVSKPQHLDHLLSALQGPYDLWLVSVGKAPGQLVFDIPREQIPAGFVSYSTHRRMVFPKAVGEAELWVPTAYLEQFQLASFRAYNLSLALGEYAKRLSICVEDL